MKEVQKLILFHHKELVSFDSNYKHLKRDLHDSDVTVTKDDVLGETADEVKPQLYLLMKETVYSNCFSYTFKL